MADRWFAGHYDGGGHKVTGVFTKPGGDSARTYQGLFGHVEGKSEMRASIENLGVENSYIQGGVATGGLVGLLCHAEIRNCYVNATVNVQSYYSGGVVGQSYDDNLISNCYFAGSITGYGETGGIVGYFTRNSTLINCFSVGSVSGTTNVGQVIGLNDVSTTSVDHGLCASGSAIGTGSVSGAWVVSTLSSQAKEESLFTFRNNWNTVYPWDFASTWEMRGSENDGYPVLQHENWAKHRSATLNGMGTAASPYVIDSAEALATLAYNVRNGTNYSSAYFKQTANIDLGGYEWAAIGNQNTQFKGNYDGGGYIIKGLDMTVLTPYNGLFGRAVGAVIKNITIKSAIIKAYDSYVGGLVGWAEDGTTIENCKVEAQITTEKDVGIVGGIVGLSGGLTISNCNFYGTVNIFGVRAGGIVAQSANSAKTTISDCHNYGNISTNDSASVGGILGYGGDADSSNVVIENCISEGIVEGRYEIGGIAGHLQSGGIVRNCHSTSHIRLNYNSIYYSALNNENYFLRIGGIVGFTNNSSIINCSYVGNVNYNFCKPIVGGSPTGVTVTSCYSIVNRNKYYTSGDFSEWGLITGMNEQLPMQKGLYHVAQFGAEVNAGWFAGKGFEKI